MGLVGLLPLSLYPPGEDSDADYAKKKNFIQHVKCQRRIARAVV
jgi:hypothetical protein